MISYIGDPDRIVRNDSIPVAGWQLDLAVWTGLTPRYMSKTYAAKIMKVSRQTIYNMIEDERIKTDESGKLVESRSLFDYLLRRERERRAS
jgi:hypothetical protein